MEADRRSSSRLTLRCECIPKKTVCSVVGYEDLCSVFSASVAVAEGGAELCRKMRL